MEERTDFHFSAAIDNIPPKAQRSSSPLLLWILLNRVSELSALKSALIDHCNGLRLDLKLFLFGLVAQAPLLFTVGSPFQSQDDLNVCSDLSAGLITAAKLGS